MYIYIYVFIILSKLNLLIYFTQMGAELCQPCVEFLNEANKLETNELVSCFDVYYIYV